MNMEPYIDAISDTAPRSDEEYIAQDGLIHCRKCGQALQTKISFLGKEKVVRCVCKCIRDKQKAFTDREKQDETERRRKVCFTETNMGKWTFAHDDRKNPELSDAMKRYVDNFNEFRTEGKGLLLYGNVGTGKTYLAACIANALIDEGYHVLMTNFARLTNQIQGTYEGKQEYIDGLNRYTLLIIDDLGAERRSEYMQETVFNIIDARYRSGLPVIITTNLSAEELKKPQEIGYQRIYDRVLERCFPVAIKGASRRRENLRETFSSVQERLGL